MRIAAAIMLVVAVLATAGLVVAWKRGWVGGPTPSVPGVAGPASPGTAAPGTSGPASPGAPGAGVVTPPVVASTAVPPVAPPVVGSAGGPGATPVPAVAPTAPTAPTPPPPAGLEARVGVLEADLAALRATQAEEAARAEHRYWRSRRP